MSVAPTVDQMRIASRLPSAVIIPEPHSDRAGKRSEFRYSGRGNGDANGGQIAHLAAAPQTGGLGSGVLYEHSMRRALNG